MLFDKWFLMNSKNPFSIPTKHTTTYIRHAMNNLILFNKKYLLDFGFFSLYFSLQNSTLQNNYTQASTSNYVGINIMLSICILLFIEYTTHATTRLCAVLLQ